MNKEQSQVLAQALEALKESVDIIKSWHGSVAWDIYYEHSPEMKRLRAAIASIESLQLQEQPHLAANDGGLTFRKKPVVIEAVRVERRMDILSPEWFYAAVESNKVILHNMGKWSSGDAYLTINTLEGVMRADEGDWVICGVQGELYPCKPDIFAATYEAGAAPKGQTP